MCVAENVINSLEMDLELLSSDNDIGVCTLYQTDHSRIQRENSEGTFYFFSRGNDCCQICKKIVLGGNIVLLKGFEIFCRISISSYSLTTEKQMTKFSSAYFQKILSPSCVIM